MLVQVVISALIMVAGVTDQALYGYYHFEFAVYFKELFLVVLPQS